MANSKTQAALALVHSMDDWEVADFIEGLGKHLHGYDINAEDTAQRIRDDAEPRGNCDFHCDIAREERPQRTALEEAAEKARKHIRKWQDDPLSFEAVADLCCPEVAEKHLFGETK